MSSENSKQRLMVHLAEKFLHDGVVSSRIEFSEKYLGMTFRYYTTQRIYNNDLTIKVSINFLTNVRKNLKKYKEINNSFAGIHDDIIKSLEYADEKLLEYIRSKFKILDIIVEDNDDSNVIHHNDGFYGVII